MLVWSRSGNFFGWRVVAAAFVMAMFGWGIGFYGPAVLLHSVREARDWSVSIVSGAVTLHFLFGALVVANLPRLYRRFGVAAVTKAGAFTLGLGVVGWAQAAAPWQLYLAALLSGAGWVAMGAAALNAIIAPWFVRTRPVALATAYNGASIGGVIFSPLLVAAIAMFGFQAAMLLVAIVMFATIWLLAEGVFSRSPAELGQCPDGDATESDHQPVASPDALPLPGERLWTDRKFLTLAFAMALGLFAQAGLLAHLLSLLVPALGVQNAGFVMGLATASAIGGRMLVGFLMPAGIDRRVMACFSLAVQIAGSFALIAAMGSNIPLLVLGVVLFGIGIGNATSLPPLIAQVEFVTEDSQRVIALVVAISQATYAFAPVTFGLLRTLCTDADSGAPQVFLAAILVQAAAISAYFLGRRRRTMGQCASTKANASVCGETSP